MTLKFPKGQSDIKLSQAIKIFNIIENDNIQLLSKQVAVISIWTGHPVKDLTKVSLVQIQELFNKIGEIMIEEPENQFERIIKLGGREYGFIPDLNEITAAEFADIDQLSGDGFKVFNKILAILFREVIANTGELYAITDYLKEPLRKRKKRERIFLNMDYATARASIGFFLPYMERLATQLNQFQSPPVK